MRHLRLKHIIFCGMSLIFIGFAAVGFGLYRLYYQPMLVSGSEPSIIRLDKSSSASSFVHTLKLQHLIPSERLFLALIRARGLSQQLKAGVYQLKPTESAVQFLSRVAHGDVMILSFRIIEGTTKSQVSANLEHAPYLMYRTSDWLSITTTYPSAEGLLLADTYYYDAGSKSSSLLHHAYTSLQQYLTASWQQRSLGLPYRTPYELLIAASIVEKEAALPKERRLIAGIIANRLRKHMPLQMDPTVIYALGPQFQGKLTHVDLHVDSPYNSYRYRGLPPTPIAMVGKDAIDAAAHPETTNFLYFVARGDGSHEFSETYEQQKAAVARSLRKK